MGRATGRGGHRPADERGDLAVIAEHPDASAFPARIVDPACRAAVKHRQAAVADSRLIRVAAPTPGAGSGEG